MPQSNLQNELLAVVQRDVPDSVNRLKGQMEMLTNAAFQQLSSLRENTGALVDNTLSGRSGGALNAAKSIGNSLGLGMFLSPLVTGIAKLFGGGKKEEPPPLVKYSFPAATAFEGSVNGNRSGSIEPVRYGQNGLPQNSGPVSNQNVTIQIQALDSRSIMDRSDDIARAVREAMLNSHPINGTISEF